MDAGRTARDRRVGGPAPAPREGVRRCPEPAGGRDAQRREALLELFGGLAVEGEHEDAGRIGATVDELDDPADEGLGLAGARRGEHARGAVSVLDGGALGIVESHGVRAADRAGRSRGRGAPGPAGEAMPGPGRA